MNTGALLHVITVVCHFLRGRVCGRESGNKIREPAGSAKKWVRDRLVIAYKSYRNNQQDATV